MDDTSLVPELRIARNGGPECAFRLERITFTEDGPDVLWHAILQGGERISGLTKMEHPLPGAVGIFEIVKKMDVRIRAYSVVPDETVLEEED